MNSIRDNTKTGGLRIGNFNVTFPFARLFIEKPKLRIKIFGYKTIVISENEINSIEEYDFIPIIGQGIRFNLKSERKFGSFIHKTDKIIFWYFGNRKKLIEKIKFIIN